MAISESKKRANKKWNDENMNVKYDHIHLVIPKGKKAELQEHAANQGESLNAFVNRAIDNQIKNDKDKSNN